MSHPATLINRVDTPHPLVVSGYHHPSSLPAIPEADFDAAIPLFTDPNFTPDAATLSTFLEYAIEKNWVVPMHRYKALLVQVTTMHEDMQSMKNRLDLERNTVFRRARSVRDREDQIEGTTRALELREEEIAGRERELAEREYEVAIYLAEKEEMRRKNEGKWWKGEYWRRKMK